MRRTRGALCCVAVLALAALVAGCGDDESAGTLPRLTDAPSTSAPTTPPPSTTSTGGPPGLPALPSPPADQAQTAKSARAFAGYALQLVLHSYAHNDVSDLRRAVTEWKKCDSCLGDEKVAAERLANDEFQVPDELPKPTKTYVIDDQGGRYVIGSNFDMPAGKLLNGAGEELDTMSSTTGSYFETTLSWDATGGSWRIDQYDLRFEG